MIRYLLDTTPVAGFMVGRHPAIALVQPWLEQQLATTSILVYGEVLEFIRGHQDYQTRRHDLQRLFTEMQPMTLSYAELERYAELRRSMRRPRGNGLIGDVDTLIAATAIEHGLVLVTADSDFLRVPELTYVLLAPKSFEVIARNDIRQIGR